MFLFTSILMVVTVTHMISGAVAQRGICEPLKNPKDNRMFELVDDLVQIKTKLYYNHPEADINMSWIVTLVFKHTITQIFMSNASFRYISVI